jgi:hypothetical protein
MSHFTYCDIYSLILRLDPVILPLNRRKCLEGLKPKQGSKSGYS